MFLDTTVTSQAYIEIFREFANQLDGQELTLNRMQRPKFKTHRYSSVDPIFAVNYFTEYARCKKRKLPSVRV
jgi:hypothetical protein